jgi:hypothetical protein
MTDKYIHETNRNTKAARATQKPCGKTLTGWSRYSPNCSNDRSIAQFCRSLEGCVQKRWTKSTGKQAAPFKATQTVQQAVSKTSKAPFERPKSKRLQNRVVDVATDRTDNKKAFWPVVSTFRGLVCSLSNGLELPKTRKKSQRTRRTGNSLLAKERLASYKKNPAEPLKPSYWSMKAVLCLLQPFAAPGHQKAKHPFNIAGAEEAVSRPFPLLASPRNAGNWVCIFLSGTATSSWMILRDLFLRFWNIFQKALSWSSTVRLFIAGQKEDFVRDFPDALSSNGFQPMPLSLIRLSRYGITASIVSLPTTFLMMYLRLKKQSVNLSNIFVLKNHYYVRSSKKPDLKYDSFH